MPRFWPVTRLPRLSDPSEPRAWHPKPSSLWPPVPPTLDQRVPRVTVGLRSYEWAVGNECSLTAQGFRFVTMSKDGTQSISSAINNGNSHTWHGASGRKRFRFA